MTHKMTLTGSVNEYFTIATLADADTRSANDRSGDWQFSAVVNPRPETVIAWVSLLVLIALTNVHSVYWVMVLPFWLSLVFLMGALACADDDARRNAGQGGLQ